MNNERYRIDKDENLAPILIYPATYRFFLSHARLGQEALNLYIHLIYTAERQHNNQVWATDTYLMNGLSVGAGKLKKLKSFLHRHNLIEYRQERDKVTKRFVPKSEGGQCYIRVLYKSGGTESVPADGAGGTEIVPEGQKAGGTVNRSIGSERQVPINKGSTFQKENAPPELSNHSQATTESSTARDPNGGEEKKVGTPFALASRFYERFAEEYRFTPDWQTSSKTRDLGIAKRIIVRVGEEKAEEALARYFDSEHWFTKDGRTLPDLLRHIDELATAGQGGTDAFWSQI